MKIMELDDGCSRWRTSKLISPQLCAVMSASARPLFTPLQLYNWFTTVFTAIASSNFIECSPTSCTSRPGSPANHRANNPKFLRSFLPVPSDFDYLFIDIFYFLPLTPIPLIPPMTDSRLIRPFLLQGAITLSPIG